MDLVGYEINFCEVRGFFIKFDYVLIKKIF